LSATISGLTLTGGDTDQLGSAIQSVGNVTLSDVDVSGNAFSRAIDGGAIYSSGKLSITSSSVSDNYGGEAILVHDGQLSLANSIVSGNIRNSGFFHVDRASVSVLRGTAQITNSMISDNELVGIALRSGELDISGS